MKFARYEDNKNIIKIITRIKGGIGNQLFCYAAARRLAVLNNAELVIDDISGFVRDHQYQRRYSLDRFHILARKATASERMEPFGRLRRRLVKCINRRRVFSNRTYIEQNDMGFDPRLLGLKVRRDVYLDGYWQSESYFKDIEDIIRLDLLIASPNDPTNQKVAGRIQSCNAVCVHVRRFVNPLINDSPKIMYNLQKDYYERAQREILRRVQKPYFFIFSDNPNAAKNMIDLPESVATYIYHNHEHVDACADLWLMSLCKHFIIANSTFSWWGAWLSSNFDKIIIYPDIKTRGLSSWGFDGLIPNGWIGM